MSVVDLPLDRLLHDLKQPLNLARVVAQDLRLDAEKGRLVVAELPGSLRTIERAVDETVARLEELRTLVRQGAPPGDPARGAGIEE